MKRLAPVQWYGGKGNLCKKIMSVLPPGGKPYCEPYAGGASLLFNRPPAPVEVLNDLDGDIITLYRCLQDPTHYTELRHRLQWTPYARAEFVHALEMLQQDVLSPVLRAWATFVGYNQGFSGGCVTPGNWSRTFISHRGMAGCVSKWNTRLSLLDWWHDRLSRVQIDCRDALEVIQYWDCDDAVFYVDPPYLSKTRAKGYHNVYAIEADDQHHQALIRVLLSCRGAVVLSGYANPIYAALEQAGWERIDWQTSCHAAGRGRSSGLRGVGAAKQKVPRTESVWRNPAAIARCQNPLVIAYTP